MSETRTALIVGATGLVGQSCLEYLLQDKRYSMVTSLVRKKLPLKDPKLQQEVVNFDHLESSKALVKGDDVYCCLGTTINKAGSKENFRKVDHDYVLKTARLALENGAHKFMVVTSVGADPGSGIFYTKVKGEVEEDLKALGYPELHIFRPASLSGDRGEFRFGEKVSLGVLKVFDFAMVGGLKKYKPIEAKTVARAMLLVAEKPNPGVHIYESEEIKQI
jgi:uncharacterized protein YbjT (DUF2867 family)